MSRQNWNNHGRSNGARRSEDQTRCKINGPTREAISEVQDILADAFGRRALLSPVMPSTSYGQPSGFHAFVTISRDER